MNSRAQAVVNWKHTEEKSGFLSPMKRYQALTKTPPSRKTVVGGGDGGEGGCPVSAAQGGEETPGVQPALGVGDEVELFAACLGKDLLYPPGQGFGVFLHRGPAVLTAEVNLGSVLL